jgi:DeoR/GlpR family transcriptional regulator of sugar metabolism
MHKLKRQEKILEILAVQGFCSTEELNGILQVSQTTLYRDLKELEQTGHIERQYGGVGLARRFVSNINFKVRETTNITEKEAIATRAIALIDDGDSLFLDTGTTCLLLARKLREKKRRDLTIFTNSCRVVLMLEDEPGYRVICTGGLHIKSLDVLVGLPAETFIPTVNARKYFISATSVSEQGCADTEPAEVTIKRLIASRVQQRIVLADHSKFDKMASFITIDLADIDVFVTDALTPVEKVQPFIEQGVQVIRAEGSD